MSKRHVGKTCVYCGTAPAATMDHIFAREFFPVEQRANLPKVPACRSCNGTKREIILTVMAVNVPNPSDP
jgi:5-methylcytosine-specific restriction endonuclease McrA